MLVDVSFSLRFNLDAKMNIHASKLGWFAGENPKDYIDAAIDLPPLDLLAIRVDGYYHRWI